MTRREIPFRAEAEVPVHYKGSRLSTTYRADFVCYEGIIVELKAVKQLTFIEEAQLLNYLKATGFSLGMLFNFGALSLQYKRFVLSRSPSAKSA